MLPPLQSVKLLEQVRERIRYRPPKKLTLVDIGFGHPAAAEA